MEKILIPKESLVILCGQITISDPNAAEIQCA